METPQEKCPTRLLSWGFVGIQVGKFEIFGFLSFQRFTEFY